MPASMRDRFGADVRIRHHETGDRQLFLVRGASPAVPVAGFVRSQGGRAVLTGGNWVLAEMALSAAQALRRQAGILSVGGVSVDPKRFALFESAIEKTGLKLQ